MPQSTSELLSKIAIPNHFEKVCHHCTCNMGKAKDGPANNFIGKNAEMKVIAVSKNSKVVAVKVETNVPSTNQTKHITVAVNRLAGGKPMHSNELTEWTEIEPFIIQGIVQEI